MDPPEGVVGGGIPAPALLPAVDDALVIAINLE